MADQDINDIINTLLAEGVGEGQDGMRLIAETILNRAAVRGLSPGQVVRQPRQYTGYSNPGLAAVRAQGNPTQRAIAQAAWELALQDGDPTNGADHYYAQGTMNQPGWAANMTNKGTVGGHTFFGSRPIPPGSVSNVVGTLTDTVGPRQSPNPVTASPNIATVRRSNAANNTVNQTFSNLASQPKSVGLTLGDQIGMSPIPGGRQQAPMFDAGYDSRMGAMRLFNTPTDTQGMFSYASAPTPAQQSPQLSAIRARNPTLQAALNSYVASGVGQPPSTRSVTSVPVSGNQPTLTASDRTRGNSGISTVATFPTAGMPQPRPNTTSVVATYPTTPQSFAGQDRGVPRLANIPQSFAGQDGGAPRAGTTPRAPTLVAQPTGSINPNKGQERLSPNAPGVGGINSPLIPYPVSVANRPQPRPGVSPPVQTAAIPPRVAPVPLQRPTAVGTVLDVAPPRVAPVPFAKPNFGMGGPDILPPAQVAPPVQLAPPAPPVQLQPLAVTQPAGGLLGAPSLRPQQNTQPTGVIGAIKDALGLTSAEAYGFANSFNNQYSVADALSGGASGGGDIGRGPAVATMPTSVHGGGAHPPRRVSLVQQ